jgi:hypothetical protein
MMSQMLMKKYYKAVTAEEHTQAMRQAMEQLPVCGRIAADSASSQPAAQPSNSQLKNCVKFSGFRESGAKPIEKRFGRKTVDELKPQEPSSSSLGAGTNIKRDQTKQKKQQSKTKGLKKQMKENAAPSQTSGFKLPSTLKFEQRSGNNQCQLAWNVSKIQQRAVSVSGIHQRMMTQPDFNEFESESIRNGNVAFDGHHRGSSQPLPPTFREQQL